MVRSSVPDSLLRYGNGTLNVSKNGSGLIDHGEEDYT
jgi:hypothetical protein